VTVGIDPPKHVHVAVAVDAAGRRIGQPLTVKNDAMVLTNLLKWIRSITEDALITWAIEDGRGFARRLADGLILGRSRGALGAQPAYRGSPQATCRHRFQVRL
jgi:hypothetical protein